MRKIRKCVQREEKGRRRENRKRVELNVYAVLVF